MPYHTNEKKKKVIKKTKKRCINTETKRYVKRSIKKSHQKTY